MIETRTLRSLTDAVAGGYTLDEARDALWPPNGPTLADLAKRLREAHSLHTRPMAGCDWCIAATLPPVLPCDPPMPKPSEEDIRAAMTILGYDPLIEDDEAIARLILTCDDCGRTDGSHNENVEH